MKYDHQKVDKTQRGLYTKCINPIRKRIASRYYLNTSLGDVVKAYDKNLAFYPLHTEPELTINVYAKEFMNQIEVIRLIANSLPVGTRLLIKEHPATIGRRTMGYYRKLRQIPNTILLKSETPVFEIINRSLMVFTITGTTGLEGIYLKKPVIYFGHVPYSMLPPHIAQKADIYNFPGQIRDFLDSYKWDEPSVLNFIAAIIDSSKKVNLVTELLQKKQRVNLTGESYTFEQNIQFLVEYLRQRIIKNQ